MKRFAPNMLTLLALGAILSGCAGCQVGAIVGLPNMGYSDQKVVTLYNATGTHLRIAHDRGEPDQDLRRVTYILYSEDMVITYAMSNGPHLLWVQQRNTRGEWKSVWSITVKVEARNNPCFTIYSDGAAPCK